MAPACGRAFPRARRMRRPVAILLAGAVGVAGCGELGADWKGERLARAEVLQQPVVERYDEGSPERVVLEWFRAAQRADAATAARFYSHELDLTPDEIRVRLARTASFFAKVGLRRVSDVSLRGDSATVFTELSYTWEAPNGTGSEVHRPQAFTLVREHGAWRLVDDFFLGFARSFRPFRPRRS
jgi:ketosteroid isomerase-like protein